jgi:RNA polymerase sigma-70 factor, ECF subfamily
MREHEQLIAQLVAREGRRVVARLARRLGLAHLALAEDAVQVAVMRALERWPAGGVPAQPEGWLYRVAQHEAIDQLRRSARELPLPDADEDLGMLDGALGTAGGGGGRIDGAALIAHEPRPAGRFAGELDDDELALLFAACHPSLPQATQVALALRSLVGLPLAVIADGLLTNETALAQRLARARTLLAGVTLELPAGRELPPRREAVLTALALMFRAGMQRESRALAWEAIRLARALAAHRATAFADADALAALLLLHGARLTGRFDADGDIVPLPGQPRDRWDAGMLRMGFAHLHAAQRGERLSRWHVQAGIAAEHAGAADHDHTDWPAIVRWYQLLVRLDPSPAPRLGHAIALAESGEAAGAKALLAELLPRVPATLRAHTLAALARAHERLGEAAAAREHLAAAVAAAGNEADARLLARRLETLSTLGAVQILEATGVTTDVATGVTVAGGAVSASAP